MPLSEDFDDFLDEDQGFATSAVITPALGRAYKVKGIFSNEYLDIDGGMAGFAGSNPVFESAAKITSRVEYGDLLRVNGADYRIVGIKPDGTGWIKLELEKQD